MTTARYVTTRSIWCLQAPSLGAAATLLTLAFVTNAAADQLKGHVVSVADGDTVTVLDTDRQQHKVRLMGIDAPERRQAFGTRSRQNLISLVFQQEVEVQFKKHDRYGRIVGKVLFSGSDVGLEQLKAGMAWHYKAYEREQSSSDRGRYAMAEDHARANRMGLWAANEPVPPWQFRTSRRFTLVRDASPAGHGRRQHALLRPAAI